MSDQVDSRQLRRFVVRIDHPGAGVIGTGFFVAPGWVLTCAHVVAGATEVDVVPDRSVYDGPVPAIVEARSDPPEYGRRVWPFPDLALLRLQIDLAHPCMRLHDRPEEDPAGDVDCHAWGFPPREDQHPGSPATFRFEGRTGDGFLQLKTGQAAPGLSGAPLVCPRRRAVVGIITASRDIDTDLGGWASPVAAWLTGARSIPTDLARLGEQIHRLNQTATAADPASWHQVIPTAMPTTAPATLADAGRSGWVPFPEEYLSGLNAAQAGVLREVNQPGLTALRTHLADGSLVAVLGPQTAQPLYPPWQQTVTELIDAAEEGLNTGAARTCRTLAERQPEQAIEILRRQLGGRYQTVLREVFRARRDPETGRSWTLLQELVCRCPLRGVVTTTFDAGIVDVRMRVRPFASATGFASWTDAGSLNRWRCGEVFVDEELPVLFAHGHHNQPEAMVLATTEYRRAYAGPLADVLDGLLHRGHLVWIGFPPTDQRIPAMLREVAERTGRHVDPDGSPRHVTLTAWNPDGGDDPHSMRELAAIQYGADLVLYPAPGGDHTALAVLLGALVDPVYPPAADFPTQPPTPIAAATWAVPAGPKSTAAATTVCQDLPPTSGPPVLAVTGDALRGVPVRWEHDLQSAQTFTGRVEELGRLDRWAAETSVRLIAVNAWGGAGKTAVVTHWLHHHDPARHRSGVRGVFIWSFYTDPSADAWAARLLDWAHHTLHVPPAATGIPTSQAVTQLLLAVPLLLVLDGLEVVQEGPASDTYGRLLDGGLRVILTAVCRLPCRSLLVLTSRFPFADLQPFDGKSARILDVPPFTPVEGAVLLAAADPTQLDDPQRHALVAAVDGHALAVATIAAILTEYPGTATVHELQTRLAEARRTQQKLGRVLRFYAERLTLAHRHLVAAVALFSRPVTIAQVLAVTDHGTLAEHLNGWDAAQIEAAVRSGPLKGLLSWHPDATISAHPLVRDTFRPLALGAAQIAAEATLTDIPHGIVTTREQALRVVEAIELSLDANQWHAADDLHQRRTDNGRVWRHLPAARLGQRAAAAFVSTPERRKACCEHLTSRRMGFYLNEMGLFASDVGDLGTARGCLQAAADHYRDDNPGALAITLWNLAECFDRLGQTREAIQAATEALSHVDTNNWQQTMFAYAYMARTKGMAGDTTTAERLFTVAARLEHTRDLYQDHLYSLPGVLWAQHLARTGRSAPARRLTTSNLTISQQQGWNENLACCRVLLARIDLTNPTTAAHLTQTSQQLTAAIATFHDGDNLVQLADALTVAAEHARRTGDLGTAAAYAAEALDIAAPRELTSTHIAALAAQARIAAGRFTAGHDRTHLHHGRDAADAAVRLATGPHPLPWAELDAASAHTYLDRAEAHDNGWAARVSSLRDRLIPTGLDPDPLTTIELEAGDEPEEMLGLAPPSQRPALSASDMTY